MAEVYIEEILPGVSLVATSYGDVDLNLIYVKDGGILLDTSTSSIIVSIVDKVGLPKVAIITHPHEDHAGGSRYLAERGVRVIAHEYTKGLLYNSSVNVDSFFPMRHRSCFNPEYVDSFIKDYVSKIGSPTVTESFRGSLSIGNVKCIEAPGHVLGMTVCQVGDLLFTSDAVQGTGLRGRSTTDSIPQVSSIDDYIQTLNKLLRLRINYLVPGHNFLPYSKRVLTGNEAYDFLEKSIESIQRIVELSMDILSKEPLTICEFAEKLLKSYGVKRGLYPQALITASAVIKYLAGRGVLRIVREGDVELYAI